ncbi:MAG: type II secretion system protein [Chlamydiota bacterium]|nr:type II secretion system protein [Chlamydiota bacterium]
MRLKTLNKRCVTLIEVLIAFTIITMCLFPLLYPHVFIIKQQSEFTQKIELDHQVNLLYGEFLSRLYTNEIPWSDLFDSRDIEINDELKVSAGIAEKVPYKGTYHFAVERKKESEDLSKVAVLLSLTFKFNAEYSKSSKPLVYTYQIFALRNVTADLEESVEEELE